LFLLLNGGYSLIPVKRLYILIAIVFVVNLVVERASSDQDHNAGGRQQSTQGTAVVVVAPLFRALLPPELHGNMRSGSHMRARWRRLFLRHAAANGFQLQASFLGSFHGASHGLANE